MPDETMHELIKALEQNDGCASDREVEDGMVFVYLPVRKKDLFVLFRNYCIEQDLVVRPRGVEVYDASDTSRL